MKIAAVGWTTTIKTSIIDGSKYAARTAAAIAEEVASEPKIELEGSGKGMNLEN